MQEIIEIRGQKWAVIQRETAADYEAQGLKNLVQFMNETGRIAQLTVRKPKGRVEYFVAQFAPKAGYEGYSKPFSLGRR